MAFEIAKRLLTGNKAIAIPGTAEKLLAGATACFRVDVCADVSNVYAVVVGDANVVAAAGTQRGTILLPGEVVSMYIDDVSKIYADAIGAGERVCFTYYVSS